MSEKKFVDVNTHQFTLEALAELYDNYEKLSRKISRVKFSNRVRTVLVLVAIYYVYNNLNQKLKEKETAK